MDNDEELRQHGDWHRVPGYLLDLMPKKKYFNRPKTANDSSQMTSDAKLRTKQRNILQYCRPEYFRSKFNINSIGRNVPPTEKHFNFPTTLITEREQNLAVKEGRKFLHGEEVSQRLTLHSPMVKCT